MRFYFLDMPRTAAQSSDRCLALRCCCVHRGFRREAADSEI